MGLRANDIQAQAVVQPLRYCSQLQFSCAVFAPIAIRRRGLDCFLTWSMWERGLLTLIKEFLFTFQRTTKPLLIESVFSQNDSTVLLLQKVALNWCVMVFQVNKNSVVCLDLLCSKWDRKRDQTLFFWEGVGSLYLKTGNLSTGSSTGMLFQAAANLRWDVTIQYRALSINIECWKIKTTEKSQGQ